MTHGLCVCNMSLTYVYYLLTFACIFFCLHIAESISTTEREILSFSIPTLFILRSSIYIYRNDGSDCVFIWQSEIYFYHSCKKNAQFPCFWSQSRLYLRGFTFPNKADWLVCRLWIKNLFIFFSLLFFSNPHLCLNLKYCVKIIQFKTYKGFFFFP